MHDPDPRHAQLGQAMRAVRRQLGLAQRTVAKHMGCTRRLLSEYPASELVGITCLCDGADQIFAQAVLDLGGALEVVVPAERYRDGLDSPQARAAYDVLFAHAKQVETLPFVESTEQAHMAGGRHVVDHSDVLVAVWDGKPARGYGGTADFVAYARERGTPVRVVWPEGATRD